MNGCQENVWANLVGKRLDGGDGKDRFQYQPPAQREKVRQRRDGQGDRRQSEVLARVQGSWPAPYRVKISLKNFSTNQKEKVKALITGDPALALGKLSEEILFGLAKQKIPLLLGAWDEPRANCSCADWANPCKYLAAVCYLLANEKRQGSLSRF